MKTRLAAACWTLFVIVASLLPKEAMIQGSWNDIAYFDKFSHLISYALLVFLWSKSLHLKTTKITAGRIAFYSAIVLGCIIEILQWQLNVGRYFEFLDIIANIIGSIIGLTVFYKINKS